MTIVGYKELIHIVICGDDYEFTIRGKRYTLPRKGEAAPTVGNVIHHRPLVLVDEIRIGGPVRFFITS